MCTIASKTTSCKAFTSIKVHALSMNQLVSMAIHMCKNLMYRLETRRYFLQIRIMMTMTTTSSPISSTLIGLVSTTKRSQNNLDSYSQLRLQLFLSQPRYTIWPLVILLKVWAHEVPQNSSCWLGVNVECTLSIALVSTLSISIQFHTRLLKDGVLLLMKAQSILTVITSSMSQMVHPTFI